MALLVQKPKKTRKIKMKSNDDFIRVVNEGLITLDDYGERFLEGFWEGQEEKHEIVHYALYTAALTAAEKLYGLDDKAIYSLFEAMKEEVTESLCSGEKIRDKWAEMRERLTRVANDVPDPDMSDKEMPDGKFYYEK